MLSGAEVSGSITVVQALRGRKGDSVRYRRRITICALVRSMAMRDESGVIDRGWAALSIEFRRGFEMSLGPRVVSDVGIDVVDRH